MAQVIYRGRADVRELAAEDLKKAGVEGFKKTRFPRNTPVEVSDEVAAALTNPDYKLFGNFELYEEPQTTPATEPTTEATPAQAPLNEGQDPANSNAPEAETSGSTRTSSKSRS